MSSTKDLLSDSIYLKTVQLTKNILKTKNYFLLKRVRFPNIWKILTLQRVTCRLDHFLQVLQDMERHSQLLGRKSPEITTALRSDSLMSNCFSGRRCLGQNLQMPEIFGGRLHSLEMTFLTISLQSLSTLITCCVSSPWTSNFNVKGCQDLNS